MLLKRGNVCGDGEYGRLRIRWCCVFIWLSALLVGCAVEGGNRMCLCLLRGES